MDYEPLVNDLRVCTEKAGGYVFVHLYDADDYDKFMLGEDEIVSLRNYLNKVIQDNKLEPQNVPTRTH